MSGGVAPGRRGSAEGQLSRGRAFSPRRGRAAGRQDADGSAASLSRSLKEVFEAIGGAAAMNLWAADNPAAFYALLARVTGGPKDSAGPAVVALLSDRPLTEEEWLRELDSATQTPTPQP